MTDELIDTPSPFASVEEWKDFLIEVRKWPDSAKRSELIALAEKAIADHVKAITACLSDRSDHP